MNRKLDWNLEVRGWSVCVGGLCGPGAEEAARIFEALRLRGKAQGRSVTPVPCLGMCQNPESVAPDVVHHQEGARHPLPCVMVGDRVHCGLSPEELEGILDEAVSQEKPGH